MMIDVKYFDQEVAREALQKANEMALVLYEKYGAKKVYLFGSLAWGWFGAESDIDLLVVGLAGECWEADEDMEPLASPTEYHLICEDKAGLNLIERVFARGILLPDNPEDILASMAPPTQENRCRYLEERIGDILKKISIPKFNECTFNDSSDGLAGDMIIFEYYPRMERIFSLIARLIDGDPIYFDVINDIDDRKLLKRMGEERTGIRPPVLSAETLQMAEEMRRFRYIRQYTPWLYKPNEGFILMLEAWPELDRRFKDEIKAFLNWMRKKHEL